MRAATNSDPKLDVSTVFWRFENHMMGARLQKIIIPVWERRVTQLPAWSASTKQVMTILFPLGGGALMGIASWASG